MGQAELRSPSFLSPKSGPLIKGVANSNIKTEANSYLPRDNGRSDRIEPPLPVTPERLELIKAYAKGRARIADEAATSRIAQRFAPRTPDVPPLAEAKPRALPPQTLPLTGLNAGIRRLTAVLAVAAILPNLTLAVFWLGLVDPPWSEAVAPSPKEIALSAAKPASPPPNKASVLPIAQPTGLSPVLTAPTCSMRCKARVSVSLSRSTALMGSPSAASSSSKVYRRAALCPMDIPPDRRSGD